MRSLIHIPLLLLWASPLAVFAQVHVEGGLELTGAAPSDRQVFGLPNSTDPQAVLTAGTEQSGAAITAMVSPGNLWVIELPALGTAPAAGTHMVVKAPVPTSGNMNIVLNGTGPYAIRTGSSNVDGESLAEGSMLSLVFDGTAFQLINGHADLRRDCPSGTVAVNAQFCIEPTERAPTDFFDAAVACAALDRRLCSWGEWYAACLQASALALIGMNNNFEWTNNTSNEDNSARIVGQGQCDSAGNGISTGSVNRNSRCCYTR